MVTGQQFDEHLRKIKTISMIAGMDELQIELKSRLIKYMANGKELSCDETIRLITETRSLLIAKIKNEEENDG